MAWCATGWGLPKSTLWLMWRLVTQFVVHIDLTILPVSGHACRNTQLPTTC